MKKYKSVKEFVNDMLDNPGRIFYDGYGRRWKYANHAFYFGDIGKKSEKNKLDCLHLFRTNIMSVGSQNEGDFK